jgi:hypothetical protein
LRIGESTAEVRPSYVSDALGDLLRAARSLTEESDELRVRWEEEPALFYWFFTREESSVRVQLVNDVWEVLFDASCPFIELIRALAHGARELLVEEGAAGYQAKWVGHPFPMDDLTALERWLTIN